MISESLTSALKENERAIRLYKKYEYETFKGFHRLVMEDHGVPTLKKRAFEMPGYRKIMDDGSRDVYINAVDRQAKKVKNANAFSFDDLSESPQLVQDIVPLSELAESNSKESQPAKAAEAKAPPRGSQKVASPLGTSRTSELYLIAEETEKSAEIP